MAKVYHDLVVNVETGAYTVKPVLDIHQGDSNTHVLLVKLRDSKNNFVSISETSKANIKFFYDDTLIMSSAVEVVNAYRGVLQYLIGPALVKNSGRYTVYLDISQCECDCACGPTVSFTMTVSKCHDQGFSDSDIEVTITKEQLNDIMAHLANAEIHLDETDRDFLDTFVPLKEDLERLVETATPGVMLRTAFTTVDFKSQMTDLTRDEVVEGKIVRVNYPDYDGDPSTVNEEWYNPKYYACHLLGDDETIEWVVVDFTDGVSPRLRELEDRVAGIGYEVSHEVVHTTDDDEKVLSIDGTEIKSTLTIDTYRDQADDTVYISLKGINGEEISRIDASQFVKDGMLDSVSYDPETHILTLVFNTDAGKETINIDISMEFEAIQEELDKKVDKGQDLSSSTDNLAVGSESMLMPEIGQGNIAVGQHAQIAGRDGHSTNGAIALGYYTSAIEDGSIAIGCYAHNFGLNSIDIGYGTYSDGERSIAIGDSAGTPNADDAVAIGNHASARSDKSVAVGSLSDTSGEQAIAIGYQALAQADDAIQIGQGSNNVAGTANIRGYQVLDAHGKIPNERLSPDSAMSDSSTNPVQNKIIKQYVDTSIAGLPMPMQFKGTVGDNGTVEWNELPAASASNEGYTYKVVTDHATTPICNENDTIVSNGSEWVVIPSGDEPSGTVTNVATGDGLTGGPITSSGTIAHSNADGYKHLPAGGESGKFVKWSANGTGAWDNITKVDVGLGNVDNTSDLDKPISTETKNYVDEQIALWSPIGGNA